MLEVEQVREQRGGDVTRANWAKLRGNQACDGAEDAPRQGFAAAGAIA